MTVLANVYRTTERELSRFPARFVNINLVRANAASLAVGHVFYPGSQAEFLVINSVTLTCSVQANAGSETRVQRQRIELLDITSGASLGSLWDAQVRDAAGAAINSDYNPAALALPAGTVLGSYSWNPILQGVMIPPGVQLRHQSFLTGGTTSAHGITTQLTGYTLPQGNLIR